MGVEGVFFFLLHFRDLRSLLVTRLGFSFLLFFPFLHSLIYFFIISDGSSSRKGKGKVRVDELPRDSRSGDLIDDSPLDSDMEVSSLSGSNVDQLWKQYRILK